MAAGLLVVQASHSYLSEQGFLIFNRTIFVVGVVTCLTYPLQVRLWEGGGRIYVFDILIVGLLALLAALFVVLFQSFGLWLIPPLWIYIYSRSMERFFFNASISAGYVHSAYAVAIIFITIELLVWLVSAGATEENARFFLPGLFLCSFLLLVMKKSTLLSGVSGPRVLVSNSVFLIAHSFFLLAVVMLDRLLVSDNYSTKRMPAADYLLLFSYAGAVYSLMVSIFEIKRPAYIKEAKASPFILSFIFKRKVSGDILTSFGICGLLFLLAGFFLQSSAKYLQVTFDWYTWIFLSLFFSFFYICAFVQIYFIGKRMAVPLILGWGVAFLLKAAGSYMQDMAILAVLNFLSAITCFICSLIFGVLYEKYSFSR